MSKKLFFEIEDIQRLQDFCSDLVEVKPIPNLRKIRTLLKAGCNPDLMGLKVWVEESAGYDTQDNHKDAEEASAPAESGKQKTLAQILASGSDEGLDELMPRLPNENLRDYHHRKEKAKAEAIEKAKKGLL